MNSRRHLVLLGALVFCALLVAFLMTFVVAYVTVRDGRAVRGLEAGDGLLVSRSHYAFHACRRGDVVCLRRGDETRLRRVLALPGETLEIRKGLALINGEPVVGIFRRRARTLSLGPLYLAPGQLFVVTDGVESRDDSVSWGPVHMSELVGKPVLIVWPPVRKGPLD